MDREWYTPKDLEPIVNKNPKTIHRWISDGKFPPPTKVDKGRSYWDHMTYLLIKVAFGEKKFTGSETRVISFFNQKGGVGKTTSAINVAASLAYIGYRVLLVDLDPQGHAGLGLGVDFNGLGTYQVMFEFRDVRQAIQTVQYQAMGESVPRVVNLSALYSDIDLAVAEQRLLQLPMRYEVFDNVLTPIKNEFHFVIVDCPPSLGNLTLNALYASTDVLVPCSADTFALRGLSHLFQTVDEVCRPKRAMGLGHPLHFLGVLVTNREKTSVQKEHEKLLRNKFRGCVFKTAIPHYTAFQQSKSQGVPVLELEFAKSNPKASQAYLELAYEILEKVKPNSGLRSMEDE